MFTDDLNDGQTGMPPTEFAQQNQTQDGQGQSKQGQATPQAEPGATAPAPGIPSIDDNQGGATLTEDNFPPENKGDVDVLDTDTDVENTGGKTPDLVDPASDDDEGDDEDLVGSEDVGEIGGEEPQI